MRAVVLPDSVVGVIVGALLAGAFALINQRMNADAQKKLQTTLLELTQAHQLTMAREEREHREGLEKQKHRTERRDRAVAPLLAEVRARTAWFQEVRRTINPFDDEDTIAGVRQPVAAEFPTGFGHLEIPSPELAAAADAYARAQAAFLEAFALVRTEVDALVDAGIRDLTLVRPAQLALLDRLMELTARKDEIHQIAADYVYDDEMQARALEPSD